MDSLPLTQLNLELEQFRKEISEKVRTLAEDAGKLSKEDMDARVEEIHTLQSTIQIKTSQYFNMVAEKTQKKSYTPEQVAELTASMKENLKHLS